MEQKKSKQTNKQTRRNSYQELIYDQTVKKQQIFLHLYFMLVVREFSATADTVPIRF